MKIVVAFVVIVMAFAITMGAMIEAGVNIDFIIGFIPSHELSWINPSSESLYLKEEWIGHYFAALLLP